MYFMPCEILNAEKFECKEIQNLLIHKIFAQRYRILYTAPNKKKGHNFYCNFLSKL